MQYCLLILYSYVFARPSRRKAAAISTCFPPPPPQIASSLRSSQRHDGIMSLRVHPDLSGGEAISTSIPTTPPPDCRVAALLATTCLTYLKLTKHPNERLLYYEPPRFVKVVRYHSIIST